MQCLFHANISPSLQIQSIHSHLIATIHYQPTLIFCILFVLCYYLLKLKHTGLFLYIFLFILIYLEHVSSSTKPSPGIYI